MAQVTKRRRFGRVRRLPSGRYQARYPDSAARLIAAPDTFATKAAAERFLSTIETDLIRNHWTDPRSGRQLFGEWAEEWWGTVVNLRPTTRERDRGYINRYVLPTFGDFELSRITHLQVRSWVAELSSGLAPATVDKAFQLLAKVLAAAVDAQLIGASPCARVPLPKIERQEMRFLSPEQVRDLADAIAPRYRALVLVGAYTGLRIGELGGLRRQRVDLLRGRIDVAEIAVEVAGTLTYGPPKTRAGRRIVPMPRAVAVELGRHLETFAVSDFVFPGPEGGPLRAASWRQRFWHPAATRAGLEPPPLRPHDLRHTAVALWIAEGANPKQIATLAGHTSVSFTLDRYGHLFPAQDDELMDRLDRTYETQCPTLVAPNGARGGHAGVLSIKSSAAS
ncbi:MAG: tyrosine-type recombinase/integrase [Acidimicrobiales bacterium]